MHTLLLTERIAAGCRLPDDDLDFLLARHSTHLRIVPAREGHVVLTPTRLVGLIVGPSVRLVVRPKLPLRSFAHLLGLEAQPSAPDEGKEFDLLGFLALQLAQLIEERVRAGLQRGYVEQHSEGTMVQGRLDLPATLREAPRRDRLHSTRDDLSADVPCNQLLRAMADRLVGSALLDAEVRTRLTRVRDSLAEVTPIAPSAEVFASLVAPAGYRPVLELCRLIAEGLQPASGMGQLGDVFLIDLERLFERYVSRGLYGAFAGSEFRVEEQRTFHLRDADTGAEAAQLRPDIVIQGADGVGMIVDAKWKRMRPHPADLYQVLAYGRVIGARHLVLVYPGRRDASRRLSLDDGASVYLQELCVTATPKSCRRSLARLGSALLRGARL